MDPNSLNASNIIFILLKYFKGHVKIQPVRKLSGKFEGLGAEKERQNTTHICIGQEVSSLTERI